MGPTGVIDPVLTIKDLSPDIRKHVRQTLKSIEALPERIRSENPSFKNIRSLEQLPIGLLPQNLYRTVVRRHYLEQLQAEASNARGTTAAPLLYYFMGTPILPGREP